MDLRGVLWKPKAYSYNVRTNQWTEGPKMGVARKCHASAILDSRLYVLGGSDGGNRREVYYYTISSNTWTYSSSYTRAYSFPHARREL